MLQGLFYGTELCQLVGGEARRAEFLLTADLSQHIFKKYQWIAPIIFAQKSGGGAKHKVREKAGLCNGEGDKPTPRAASLEQSFIPMLLFKSPRQPSGCWGGARKTPLAHWGGFASFVWEVLWSSQWDAQTLMEKTAFPSPAMGWHEQQPQNPCDGMLHQPCTNCKLKLPSTGCMRNNSRRRKKTEILSAAVSVALPRQRQQSFQQLLFNRVRLKSLI